MLRLHELIFTKIQTLTNLIVHIITKCPAQFVDEHISFQCFQRSNQQKLSKSIRFGSFCASKYKSSDNSFVNTHDKLFILLNSLRIRKSYGSKLIDNKLFKYIISSKTFLISPST